jgi:hypothetical protein
MVALASFRCSVRRHRHRYHHAAKRPRALAENRRRRAIGAKRARDIIRVVWKRRLIAVAGGVDGNCSSARRLSEASDRELSRGGRRLSAAVRSRWRLVSVLSRLRVRCPIPAFLKASPSDPYMALHYSDGTADVTLAKAIALQYTAPG